MAITLPLPVRVTAGLLATGWDTVRNLPGGLPALSVSVAGHAVRLSMRVQQEITQLAARGDEVLAVITSRPSEHPAWAHFDDEDVEQDVAGDSPTGDDSGGDDSGGDEPRPGVRARFDDPEFDVDVAWVPSGEDAFNDDVENLADGREWPDPALPEASPAGPAPADGATGADPLAVREPDLTDGGASLAGGVDAAPPARLTVVRDAPAGPSNGVPPATDASGPPALPGYDRMTLAQVRGRLRGLSPADVGDLLAHERAGAGRAPFLTLLTNRMATLEHEAR